MAIRVNSVLRPFAERPRVACKRRKGVIVAVMRTLLLLASTLLRSGQRFSPTYRQECEGLAQ